VAAIEDQRAEVAGENRRAYEHFYNNLALFSGGMVALSVTFLGYLKTLSKPVAHPSGLVANWVALFTCLGFSLFWTFFYSITRTTTLTENMLKQ
jgi:hypothetical protein